MWHQETFDIQWPVFDFQNHRADFGVVGAAAAAMAMVMGWVTAIRIAAIVTSSGGDSTSHILSMFFSHQIIAS